jgi:hypothetical protein
MCVILWVLSFFGILYLIDILNRYSYKILPRLTIDNGNFFDRKLKLKEISSLKEYIMARIAICIRMRKIGNLENEDMSNFDLEALEELKWYINNDLKQYVNNLMLSQKSKINKVSSHIECKLEHGKLDFYLSSRNSLPVTIKIRFESFSNDNPVLEISQKLTSYTYRLKSKHVRFINPDVKIINEIKNNVDRIALNVNQAQLKAA